MKIISGGRQTGKTTKMIDWLKEHEDGILYVHSEEEARRLRTLYDTNGIYGLAVRIVPVSQLPLRGTVNYPPVAIDNVDTILRRMFGNVQVVTVTEEGDDG